MKRMMIVIVLSLFLSTSTVATAATQKEMIYIGGMDYVFAVDPETKEVTNIEIPGAARNFAWTRDGHDLFVGVDSRKSVAHIDTKTNEVVDLIDFTHDGYTTRVFGFVVDHAGDYMYATAMRSKIDGVEFKTLPPALLVMDLNKKEIVKEVEVPYGTHTMQLYEDGTKIALWGRDLMEYDIEKGEWRVLEEAMYPSDPNAPMSNYLNFWPRDAETDYYATVTNYRYHPDTGETTEGSIGWDLRTGDITYYEFDEEPRGFFSTVISKDRSTMYSGLNFLAKTSVDALKHEVVVPSSKGSYYAHNISADNTVVYASGAGPDISFYDAETMELIEVVDLPTDTMDLRVVMIDE